MLNGLFQRIFFPITNAKRRLDTQARGFGTTVKVLFAFMFDLIRWLITVMLLAGTAWVLYFRVGDFVGVVPMPVLIAGTGSMYPTFPKGEGKTPQEREQENVAAPLMYRFPGGVMINGNRYFGHQLKRGDIISFSNVKTMELIAKEGGDVQHTTGFVKRVIALPGDTVEIRDGFVILNDEIIQEPYTASGRSTFGGTSLPDCRPVTVPEGKLVVLGDNRKGSNDSRNELGFVDIADVDRYMPMSAQTPYEGGWHDTTHDKDTANKPVLDPQQYLTELNKIRTQHNVTPLKYDKRLEASARARAQNMLKYDDLSFTATKSGYTPSKAMSDAGYSNIVWGEAPTLGYYTADELLENYAQSDSWQKFLLDKTYDDTGIAAVIGNLNGCPVQLVVQHVAGYVPPNYKRADIDSWKKLRENLQSVLPSWEKSRNYGGQYEDHKQDYERVISILNERIAIANVIIARMESNQWLTNDEKAMVEKDNVLAQEENALADKLNTR